MQCNLGRELRRRRDFAITTQPPAQKTVPVNTPANVQVIAPGATSYEWYVLGSDQKIGGQTTNTLTVPVTQTTSFWVRAGNGTCTVDSTVVLVIAEVCTPPSAAISAPSSIGPAAQATATVAGEGDYTWTIPDGSATIVAGQHSKTVTFRAFCSGPVTLTVSVTGSCGAPVTNTISVPVVAPSLTVSASPSSIAKGQSSTLNVAVAGGGVWQIAWGDGYVHNTSAGQASRPPVAPAQTTTYAVTALNGCTGSYGSAVVTVIPPAPVSLVANRIDTGIVLTWAMPAGASADSYVIERCSANCTSAAAAWLAIVSTAANAYVDPGVTSGKAYLYRVYAVRGGTASLASTPDFATNIAFTDDPVTGGVTTLKLVHLSELRTAVNALRWVAGLAPASFTDGMTNELPIRAIHFAELRAAANAARSQLGAAAVSFNPPVAAGLEIRASHVNQLRGGVR